MSQELLSVPLQKLLSMFDLWIYFLSVQFWYWSPEFEQERYYIAFKIFILYFIIYSKKTSILELFYGLIHLFLGEKNKITTTLKTSEHLPLTICSLDVEIIIDMKSVNILDNITLNVAGIHCTFSSCKCTMFLIYNHHKVKHMSRTCMITLHE